MNYRANERERRRVNRANIDQSVNRSINKTTVLSVDHARRFRLEINQTRARVTGRLSEGEGVEEGGLAFVQRRKDKFSNQVTRFVHRACTRSPPQLT